MGSISSLDGHLRKKIKDAACLAATKAKNKMSTNQLTKKFEEKSCDKETNKTSS